MKKLYVIAALIMMAALTVFTAHRAHAVVAGTPHDFSGESWSGGEICVVCHTPHNAVNNSSAMPLWNHALPDTTYTLYSSPYLKETPDQPGHESLVCLSCHDGTVAIDRFGGRTGTIFLTGTDSEFIDTNLADDHPVGILWSHKGAANCSNCHFSGTSDNLPFYSGKVECSTCHDPHEGAAGENFLRMTVANSAICLYCHGK